MPRLLVLVALLAFPVAARADVPLPEKDPFFKVPAHLAHVANGTILASRSVQPTGGPAPLPATAWQVKYKTLTARRRPTATVTTVLVPEAAKPAALISYQTAEDGVGSKCSPSYALTAGAAAPGSNSEAETSAMTYILLQGYALSVPDYEGPDSAFLGGRGEGRQVLDGLRAARAFKPAGLAKSPLAMIGYSGGAYATSIAGQIQRHYASDLALKGIALGGEPAEIKTTFEAFDGSAVGGAIFIGLVGIDRAVKGAPFYDLLNAKGQAIYKASGKDCINDAAERTPAASADQYSKQPHAVDQPKITKLLHRLSPLGIAGVPTAPVYDYHAINDELAPIGSDRELVKRYCADGVKVQHYEDAASEHISLTATGLPAAIAYLGDRFAGKPAPSTCE